MEEVLLLLGGGAIALGGVYLGGRRKSPPKTSQDVQKHIHRSWKKGADGVYFCLQCGDRYMDGKP